MENETETNDQTVGETMMRRLVLCCFKPGSISYYACVPPEVPQRLADGGFDFRYVETPEQFLDDLPQAEIAIAAVFRKEWLTQAPRLKWVASYAAGRERIPERELREAGIQVTFGQFHGRIMAETVLGMMLFTARGLGTAYRLQKTVQWCDTVLHGRVWTLRDQTCLIMGLGHIGQHVARLTKALGMYNIGIKRVAGGTYPDVDRVVALEDFRTVLPQADHLVLILPHVAATDRLIGRAELELMKPGAALYNVGRGNCLDETALYQALREQKIAWAALDVFEAEPLPMESPLRELDNILILPHSSAFASEYYGLFFREFLEDWEAYRKNASEE
jgi:phosphoglycerate dehydrogenase-like enzyme